MQKTRTLKPVAEPKPHRKQQLVQRRRSETVVRDEPPPGDNSDFLTKALIFGSGVAVGGALKH
ncbi:hypothetical protein [Mesorhizobium sp. ES1-4]|uniref:hypothetical protein n=1 Tax=Mesorhizobium sp. ES1-4 TaxID=2876627 RepID=UPI001CCEC717|nr:hypothetical protein [Mesorhizobium sp. ES1-4]MBZ9794846.1 hypothetical protein [Mesorhizobium sp. ES1-4]